MGWNCPFRSHVDDSSSFGAKAELPFGWPACTSLLPALIGFLHIAEPFRRSYSGVSGGNSRPFQPSLNTHVHSNNTQPGPHVVQQHCGCVRGAAAPHFFLLTTGIKQRVALQIILLCICLLWCYHMCGWTPQAV